MQGGGGEHSKGSICCSFFHQDIGDYECKYSEACAEFSDALKSHYSKDCIWFFLLIHTWHLLHACISVSVSTIELRRASSALTRASLVSLQPLLVTLSKQIKGHMIRRGRTLGPIQQPRAIAYNMWAPRSTEQKRQRKGGKGESLAPVCALTSSRRVWGESFHTGALYNIDLLC